jgi:hypothetical protein
LSDKRRAEAIVDEVNRRIFRCIEIGNRCGKGMREGWRAALAHAGGVAGIAMSVEKILRTLAPATIRRNVPRRLAAMQPDSAISRWQQTDLVPGQIKIRPSAATGYPAISRVD